MCSRLQGEKLVQVRGPHREESLCHNGWPLQLATTAEPMLDGNLGSSLLFLTRRSSAGYSARCQSG